MTNDLGLNKDKMFWSETRTNDLRIDVPALLQLSYLALCWRTKFVNIFVRGDASQKPYHRKLQYSQGSHPIMIQPWKRQSGDPQLVIIIIWYIKHRFCFGLWTETLLFETMSLWTWPCLHQSMAERSSSHDQTARRCQYQGMGSNPRIATCLEGSAFCSTSQAPAVDATHAYILIRTVTGAATLFHSQE